MLFMRLCKQQSKIKVAHTLLHIAGKHIGNSVKYLQHGKFSFCADSVTIGAAVYHSTHLLLLRIACICPCSAEALQQTSKRIAKLYAVSGGGIKYTLHQK